LEPAATDVRRAVDASAWEGDGTVVFSWCGECTSLLGAASSDGPGPSAAARTSLGI